MTELLWLLLPVAAASGWWAAKRGETRPARSSNLNTDYFKGLNYLLNEQPDQALEVFIHMVDVDGETVETHLALGNLFRRRGEVDRAIRIHQNLMARPTLDRAQRAQAVLELGLDYMRAGLLDRAENLFRELAEDRQHGAAALANLADIYQQQKDWDKAITALQRLGSRVKQPAYDVIAHMHCELADEARARHDEDAAVQHAKRALKVDRHCVRASLLLGELASGRGEYKAAIAAYRRVEEQDPQYLPETLRPLQVAYRALGQEREMTDYLRRAVATGQGVTPILLLADDIQQREGDHQALQFLIEHLRERPSVRGLARLIDLNIRVDGKPSESLAILQDLFAKLLHDKPMYRCQQCGFSAKSLHWQCPGCKRWGSQRPYAGVVGE